MTRLIKSQLTDIFARKYPVYYTKHPVYIHMYIFAPEFVPVEANSRARSVGVGMACLDFVDLRAFFDQCALVMKTVPVCLRGAFRAALRVAFEEFLQRRETHDATRHTRAKNTFHVLASNALLSVPEASSQVAIQASQAIGWRRRQALEGAQKAHGTREDARRSTGCRLRSQEAATNSHVNSAPSCASLIQSTEVHRRYHTFFSGET